MLRDSFTYDVFGACVSMPFSAPNPACHLRVFPSQEVNGFVFAYFDDPAREPDWQVPSIAEAGWTKTLTLWDRGSARLTSSMPRSAGSAGKQSVPANR